MSKNLYFVERVFFPLEETIASVSLVRVNSAIEEGNEEEGETIKLSFDRDQLFMPDFRGRIREGCYVYYDDSKQQQPFSNGNRSKIARSQFNVFNALRNELIKRYIDPSDGQESEWIRSLVLQKDTEVTSFHINVGHGNCSVILLQDKHSYRLWIVDCSILDNTDWTSYQCNLEDCLDMIADRVGLSNRNQLHVDRFFLTHCHFDHYNGLGFLINQGLIDKTTLCYINLYYQMARPPIQPYFGFLESGRS